MQQTKQPFGTRLQLLARLALNAGKYTGYQPARLAQLDDGNDCAILVQDDEGPAQVVQLGHFGALRQLFASDDGAISFAACPIPSLRWRKGDSNCRSRREGEPFRRAIWLLFARTYRTSGLADETGTSRIKKFTLP
jgi:hypothetical protein